MRPNGSAFALLNSVPTVPLRVLDLGRSPTPYQTRCRWPGCTWGSCWHPRQQPADLEFTQHLAAAHSRGGGAA